MLLVILIPFLTLATILLGFALNISWVLPVLNALPAYVVLFTVLRKGERLKAILLMIWWGVSLAAGTVAAVMLWNGRAEGLIFHGASYRNEMFDWLMTGIGRESTPSLFIPEHLLHAGVFVLLSLVTGSLVSILMGCLLMNYMSFYVGDLILHCQEAGRSTAILLAWNPWSMVRVVAFIILGVVLAEPLLSRVKGAWPGDEGRWRWIAIGLAGLGLDMLMKTFLAPHWPGWLAACFG